MAQKPALSRKPNWLSQPPPQIQWASMGVNEERDHCRINAVGGELGAFCHSAGDDGGGSGAENKVENEGDGPGEAL